MQLSLDLEHKIRLVVLAKCILALSLGKKGREKEICMRIS